MPTFNVQHIPTGEEYPRLTRMAGASAAEVIQRLETSGSRIVDIAPEGPMSAGTLSTDIAVGILKAIGVLLLLAVAAGVLWHGCNNIGKGY